LTGAGPSLLALTLAEGVREAGMVLGALAAAGAFLLPSPRARAVAVVAVLLVAPVLLVSQVWDAPPVAYLRSAQLLAAAALAAGALAAAALAALFVRRPAALALLAVAALPFRVPVVAGGQTANLLVPLYLVIGAGGLAYAWTRLHRAPARDVATDRRPGALEVALLAAVLLYALQASYSLDFGQALENVVFFYLPFALLLKLLIGLDWKPRLLRSCLAIAVALALAFVLVGFVEYATGTLLLNPKVIAANQFESFFRVNSLFFDPNIYGRFLVVVMLAVAAVLLWSPRRRDARLAAAGLLVLWAGLLLTFSQSSYAALLVGLAVLAAVRWGWRPVAGTVAAAVALALVVAILVPQALHLDLDSADALDAATSGRLGLVGGGLALWAERPLLGHGSGSFAVRFRERPGASAQSAVAASHTIPVTVSAEQGLLGLAAYLAVLIAAAGVLTRALPRPGSGPVTTVAAARAVLAAAFAALLIHTLLYAAYLEDPLTWTALAVAVGLGPLAAGRASRRAAAGAARREPSPASR
jgi:O-antigen ligase